MCKHQNCIIYEKSTVNSEVLITEGIAGKTVEAIQPLFPTSRVLVICRDCNMEKLFGAGWSKRLPRGVWIDRIDRLDWEPDMTELHSTTAAVLEAKSKLHGPSFRAGVLSALAIVAIHDERTLFDEIVSATGETDLVKTARRDGAMKWSGLSGYGYGRK